MDAETPLKHQWEMTAMTNSAQRDAAREAAYGLSHEELKARDEADRQAAQSRRPDLAPEQTYVQTKSGRVYQSMGAIPDSELTPGQKAVLDHMGENYALVRVKGGAPILVYREPDPALSDTFSEATNAPAPETRGWFSGGRDHDHDGGRDY